jgi:hypothetical protein
MVWWKVGGIVCLALILFPVFSLAEIPPSPTFVDAAVDSRVDQANRFLAAETKREFDKMQTELLNKLIENDDANFRALDGRVDQFILDARQKIIIGGFGAVLVANAIVAIILLRVTKRYSYEYYLQQIAQKQSVEIDRLRLEKEQSVAELQQRQWQQQPTQSIGAQLGQEQVASQSMMNQWQMQPAHQGAWQSPDPYQQFDQQQYRNQYQGDQRGGQ